MRYSMKKSILLFVACLFQVSFSFGADTYQVLCYHDVFKNAGGVADDVLARAYAFNNIEFIKENLIGRQDTDAVDLDKLINQFAWLKENGYNVISVQDLIDENTGKKSLPEKAVLITFDDGYESFYRYVYPLLQMFNYPALLAIEGSWIATKPGDLVQYGDEKIRRDNFLTIEQMREMAKSNLVEFASHTWNSHYGIIGNPQGNLMPSVTTRLYDPKTSTYEDDAAYRSRLVDDFDRNSRFLEKIVGKRPRVMVWPFGRYNGISQEVADKSGMPIEMTLEDGANNVKDGLEAIKRYYISGNPSLAEFARTLQKPSKQVMRVMHVDLDYIYDPDPVQQDKNLGLLLERINEAGASAVFLQAFADDTGGGEAAALYFPNRHLPLKSDLFSRASWQIQTRTTARKVFAWMPLLAFMPTDKSWQQKNSVVALNGKSGVGYHRLSPFSEEARQYIREIYEDLAKNASFSGILIHDDAVLSDYEDVSDAAGKTYGSWGLPMDVNAIRSDREAFIKWTNLKTKYISQFANELKSSAERYRKPLQLARNYYAGPVLNHDAEEWFAQSYIDGLQNFDWVAIMAMPYFEGVENPTPWLKQVVSAVKSIPGAQDKTIFELQTKDWNKNQPISNDELMAWMRMLRVEGMQNFGYYPDDPFANQPNVGIIKREFSTRSVLDQ